MATLKGSPQNDAVFLYIASSSAEKRGEGYEASSIVSEGELGQVLTSPGLHK